MRIEITREASESRDEFQARVGELESALVTRFDELDEEQVETLPNGVILSGVGA